jgi:4-amino-4-deoxy-L-arabinose transferase-like glycosyltransferase
MPAKLRGALPFLIILVLAAGLRFYALQRIPPGIYWDEVIDGREGLEAMRTRHLRVFYPVGSGREGLWINMTGVAEAVLGANPIGLRFCAALVGTLTVLFVYLLARELFLERVALFTAWFLATGFWPLWISRMCFRAVLMPLFLTASVYMLLLAWRDENTGRSPASTWLLVIFGGALYGLGFHSYIAFRTTPLLIAVLFLTQYRRQKRSGHMTAMWLATLAVWLGTAFLVALPMGLYFIRHPQGFWARATQISIFSSPQPFRGFVRAFLATVLMFNIQGDCLWLNNIACAPQLLFPVGVLFLYGLMLAARSAFRNDSQALGSGLLCAWFGILLVPQLFTLDAPNAVRVVGVITPVFVFAGLGAEALYEKLRHRKACAAAFFLGLILTGGVEVYRYFVAWARNPEVASVFAQPYVKLGQHLNSLPKGTPRYVLGSDWGVEIVKFLTQGDPSIIYLSPGQLSTTNFKCDSVIVPVYNKPMAFAELARRDIRIHAIDHEGFTVGVVQCGR